MRKFTFSFKSLLLAAGLLMGSASAWATPTVIKSWDFLTVSENTENQTALSTMASGTTTINKTVCDNLTGDYAGIALQGSGGWYFNYGGKHAYDGLRNNNGGGRLFALLSLKAGDIVDINATGGLPTSATNATYDAESSTEGTHGIYTVTSDGNFAISLTRYYQITTLTVTRDLADLEAPTYTITGANGTQRQVTLSCLTDGATIKYNTVNDKAAEGWTTYSTPFMTNETTLYAYSEKSSSTSDVITITTGAGTTLTLNAPTISRSGNSVTITSDQSEIVGDPSATIYYTYGGGDPVVYSSAITVAAEATITAYATASGYNNSGNTTRAVALFPTDVAKVVNAPQNNTYTTGALSGIDVVGTNATFQALIIDGAQWGGEDVFVQNEYFGFRNGGAGKDWYFNSASNVWLLVKNLKAGDIIVVSTTYQASGLTNATYTEKYSEGNNRTYTVTADGDVELAFKKPNSGTMHYFYGLYVYSHEIAKASSENLQGYKTFYDANYNYQVDANTTIYKASASKTAVTLTSVEGNIVPKNTPVILKTTNTSDYTMILTATLDEPASGAYDGNDLQVSDGTESNVFILAYTTAQGFGFYKYTSTLDAGDIYLAIPSEAKMLRVVVDGTASEVIAPEVADVEEEEVLYNMAGVQVDKNFKGFVINQKGEKRFNK